MFLKFKIIVKKKHVHQLIFQQTKFVFNKILIFLFVFSDQVRTMNGNHCYLCNEPKSVVGHDTQTCPNVICIKCDQKGHIYQNCSQLNIDQQKLEKSEVVQKEPKKCETCDVFTKCKSCRVSLASKKSLKKHIDLKHGFDHIKRKSEFKEETFTAKSSKIEQISDPKMHNDKKMLKALHDIEFSNDIKPKFEIKEETLAIKSSKIDQNSDIVDPKMHNDKEMLDALHDIEFPNDIKPKLEIKIKTFDVKTTNFGTSYDNYLFSQYTQLEASASPTEAQTPSPISQEPPPPM